MRMRLTILSLVLIVLVAVFTVYDIQVGGDGYDILLRNRFTGLGFGIFYKGIFNKDGLEIWHFAHTVHGGLAEKPLYPTI